MRFGAPDHQRLDRRIAFMHPGGQRSQVPLKRFPAGRGFRAEFGMNCPCLAMGAQFDVSEKRITVADAQLRKTLKVCSGGTQAVVGGRCAIDPLEGVLRDGPKDDGFS